MDFAQRVCDMLAQGVEEDVTYPAPLDGATYEALILESVQSDRGLEKLITPYKFYLSKLSGKIVRIERLPPYWRASFATGKSTVIDG
jgi:hypothetical protein